VNFRTYSRGRYVTRKGPTEAKLLLNANSFSSIRAERQSSIRLIQMTSD